jgi:predicted nucleic acid-binding protein
VGPFVLDASAVLDYLLGTDRAKDVSSVLRAGGADLRTPYLCDVEVASVIRRVLLRGDMTSERADEALIGYALLPLLRHGHLRLLPRVLELRDKFSAPDATYVALAEELGGTLVTTDVPFARAVRMRRHVEVLP